MAQLRAGMPGWRITHGGVDRGIRDKLDRLRTLDVELEVFGASGHRYGLRACLLEENVLAFESRHAVVLPDGFRAFLLEIGNGPDYGLSGLSEECLRGTLAHPFPLTEAHNPGELAHEEANKGDGQYSWDQEAYDRIMSSQLGQRLSPDPFRLVRGQCFPLLRGNPCGLFGSI